MRLITTLIIMFTTPLYAAGVEHPFGIGLGYGSARLSQLSGYQGSYFSRLQLDYRATPTLSFSLSGQHYGPFRPGEVNKPRIELDALTLGVSWRFVPQRRVAPYLGVAINWWDLQQVELGEQQLRTTGEALGFKAGLCITLGRRSCLRLEAARHLGVNNADVDQLNFGLIRHF